MNPEVPATNVPRSDRTIDPESLTDDELDALLEARGRRVKAAARRFIACLVQEARRHGWYRADEVLEGMDVCEILDTDLDDDVDEDEEEDAFGDEPPSARRRAL